ncbi:MAG: DUF4268 domain-containing protein, partial [Roseibacillus sp.]
TEDGGHMELQAIRYAAMVSSMTLAQAVQTYARFRHADEDEARREILGFLQSDSEEDPELTGEVRIVLVSANFSTEVATTVLWLNRHDLDITCIRLRPYKMGAEILIDATQIIPLPEAADYEVKLRTQEREQKRAAGRWQGELERFWAQMIRRNQDKYPRLASRSAPKVNKFSFKRGDGYALHMDVLKDLGYFTCEIILPDDEESRSAAVEILSVHREAVEEAFGGDLEWKEKEERPVFQVYHSIGGGWGSPESEWPDIQDRLVEQLLRLEAALQSAIEEIKRSSSG